mmetsp:Transcript_19272/g.48210  ORF Transcript_19272/g.48210 Transcript_19272/m.48210 type:complete len:209 (-) Transcript_19272:287-913(-)
MEGAPCKAGWSGTNLVSHPFHHNWQTKSRRIVRLSSSRNVAFELEAGAVGKVGFLWLGANDGAPNAGTPPIPTRRATTESELRLPLKNSTQDHANEFGIAWSPWCFCRLARRDRCSAPSSILSKEKMIGLDLLSRESERAAPRSSRLAPPLAHHCWSRYYPGADALSAAFFRTAAQPQRPPPPFSFWRRLRGADAKLCLLAVAAPLHY